MVPFMKNCSWSRLGLLCLLLSLYSCGSLEESYYSPPTLIENELKIDRDERSAEMEDLLTPEEGRDLDAYPLKSDEKEKKSLDSGAGENDVIF